MKTALTTIILFFSLQINSQKCNCEKKPELKEIISCGKTIFKNGAQIYWNYDCNSSWLTFENKNIKKKIFSLDKDIQDLVGRIGFVEWTEMKNHFIIKNKVISGCCEPLEIFLFDKINGNEKRNLGTLIYQNETKKNPFILTLLDYNTLLLTNFTNDNIYKIFLPKGRIERSLKNSGDLKAEEYFKQIKFENDIFEANYKYFDKNKKWKTEKIIINLKKYGR